jgi:hypothetical protein
LSVSRVGALRAGALLSDRSVKQEYEMMAEKVTRAKHHRQVVEAFLLV